LIDKVVRDAARFGEQVAKNLLAGRLVPLKAARSFSIMWRQRFVLNRLARSDYRDEEAEGTSHIGISS
jgi:hypothetical protein